MATASKNRGNVKVIKAWADIGSHDGIFVFESGPVYSDVRTTHAHLGKANPSRFRTYRNQATASCKKALGHPSAGTQA